MAKVLVTGATGFIGNYVVASLLQGGHHVVASSSSAEKARELPWFQQVQYISFDLASFDDAVNYCQYFDAPEAAIHLAWEGLPNYKAAFHIDTNLPRHYAFLTNLVRNGLTNLTVTGTCFEYGMQEGRLEESMPAQPANPYAAAKNTLRKSLQELQQQYRFHFKWVRLFYMYGKGQNSKSLLSQLQQALEEKQEVFNMSGGEQVRDYLPVEKMADYIVQTALQNRVEGIVNCCSGQPITVKQLVENYLQQQGASIRLNLGYYPYTDYEPMAFWGDNTKMKTILNTSWT